MVILLLLEGRVHLIPGDSRMLKMRISMSLEIHGSITYKAMFGSNFTSIRPLNTDASFHHPSSTIKYIFLEV